MNFLKNKHLIVAMLVAPALAIIAYFAVDQVVSEKPHAAAKGETYKLRANSNCRYKSGVCTLENGDVEVRLHVEVIDPDKMMVLLSSVLPLQGAIVSLVAEDGSGERIAMAPDAEKVNTWSATLYGTLNEQSLLRLALNVSDTLYYAETTTVFVNYETIFSRDNFSVEPRINNE